MLITGEVDFYIVDNNDPLISAYNRAYPTLYTDISRLPSEFIPHLSYPKTLFRLKMEIFARYHQNNPEIFYQQNERLQFAHDEPISLSISRSIHWKRQSSNPPINRNLFWLIYFPRSNATTSPSSI